MKRIVYSLTLIAATLVPFAGTAAAQEKAPAATAELNKVCPVTGKPADPAITTAYEGNTYAFVDAAARTKFTADREASLYHKLGGKPAIDAAIESFYVKVLADTRINHYFKDTNMTKQRQKQKAFFSAAFGGPIPWTGMDLRTAHADMTLSEADFNAVAGHLLKTLEELKVPKDLIDQVMAIAGSTKDAVLNRKPAAKK